MNFFQSVFSDDPDPSIPKSEPQNPENPPENPTPSIPSITSAWTFGTSLMKTLASKSESVIETYRRDLEEFSSGIKKETAVIREAAAKAVKDLPTSLEAGAGLAQESLESVGQAIDDLGSTVTEIIAQGKESILAVDYSDSDSDVTDVNASRRIRISNSVDLRSSKPYSRLDAQIRTIQSDMNTYLEDPEDVVEYNEWKLGFKFDEKIGEIDGIMNENDGVVGEIYKEIVPSRVDENSFWVRYFYRVYKVKMAEEARVKLVKRAISGEEDEELSWDVDEDDYEENTESDLKVEEKESVENSVEDELLEKKDLEKMCLFETENEKENEPEVGNLEAKSDLKTASEGKTDKDSDISVVSSQPDLKTASEGKTDKDSDISVVSSQPSPEEDGWDEIEDIGSSDENKDKVVVSHGSHGAADRAELHKRLSVAEDEEDLTWDIEDDDETVNA